MLEHNGEQPEAKPLLDRRDRNGIVADDQHDRRIALQIMTDGMLIARSLSA
jgi:hypothetical protein